MVQAQDFLNGGWSISQGILNGIGLALEEYKAEDWEEVTYDLEEQPCELANSVGYFLCGICYTVLDLLSIHYYITVELYYMTYMILTYCYQPPGAILLSCSILC